MGDFGFPSLPGLPTFPGNTPAGVGSLLPNNPCGLYPDLPGCASTPGIGTPPNVGGPGGITLPGGVTIPGPGPGGTTTVKLPGGTATVTSTIPSFLSNPLGYLGGTIQASGLRILFFILGFIFIIMGLYFLKETRSIVSVPIRIVKGGVKTVREAATAAAAGAA